MSGATGSDRSLREALLAMYRSGQSASASGAVYGDIRAFWPQYDANYGDLLVGLPPQARILDVGSGPGSLVAWLRDRGFTTAEGVDLSPGDVEHADRELGPGAITLTEGRGHLEAHRATYDLIVMKAILEHVPKPELLPMLEAAARALRPGGRVLVEVPNMDWLLASHERYMDLTHETGFTAGSLHALLTIVFADVSIRGSRLASPTRTQRWLRGAMVRMMRRALYVLGEGASDTLFSHRSLVAVARDPR